MKNGIKILTSMLVLLAFACGNSTKQAGTDSASQTGTDGTSDTYYSRDANDIDNMNGEDHMNSNSGMMNNDTNTPDQDRNLTQDDYDKERNKQMYTSLNMTEEQIRQYETGSRSSMDTWKRDNPDKTMTTQDRMKHQSDQLKPILDESQFNNYGQWSTSNPYRN